MSTSNSEDDRSSRTRKNVKSSGERSVAIGGSADHTIIKTGDEVTIHGGNHFYGAGAFPVTFQSAAPLSAAATHILPPMIALSVIERCKVLDRSNRVARLIGGELLPKTGPVHLGTQGQIVSSIYQRLVQSSDESRIIGLTGEAGVGKSIALRRLAGKMAREFVAKKRNAFLPIVIPLQEYIASPADLVAMSLTAESGHPKWDVLARFWSKATVHQLPEASEGSTFTSEALAEWLSLYCQTGKALILIDGVDEFLANNALITLSDLQALMKQTISQHPLAGTMHIVFTFRSGNAQLGDLASSAADVFEIDRLSVDLASQFFSLTQESLDRINDPNLKSLILTPLILSRIGATLLRFGPGELSSRSAIFETALRQVVEQSHLSFAPSSAGTTFQTTAWLEALTLVAWRFFEGLRGTLSVGQLADEIGQLHAQWTEHYSISHDTSAELVLEGCRVLQGEEDCELLLNRTVFIQNGYRTYRFSHRAWEEYLVGRYFAQCVTSGNFTQLSRTAFTSEIFWHAGERSLDFIVDDKVIEELLAVTATSGSLLVLANFGAFLANSPVPIATSALRKLLRSVRQMDPIAEQVVVNGLCYRALKSENSDAYARILRRELELDLAEHVRVDSAAGHPLIRSLEWCYRRAFGMKFGGRDDLGQWPTLSSRDVPVIAQMLCNIDTGEVSHLQRSVQIAFMKIQHSMLDDPYSYISASHFLFPLAAVFQLGFADDFVMKELPRIFDGASPIGAKYLAAPLAEVREIWSISKQMVESS